MSKPKDVEYTVVLVSSDYGESRENAEQVIEEALEYLNTHREQPGFRFAPNVSANLEIVPDVEEAQAKLRADDAVALMILHDLPDDERDAFTLECASQSVPVCHTTPASDQPEATQRPSRARKRDWEIKIRKRTEADGPPVHRISETTLTAPLEGHPEELRDRVWQLIAVMALGVMEHHWTKNPPQWNLPT